MIGYKEIYERVQRDLWKGTKRFMKGHKEIYERVQRDLWKSAERFHAIRILWQSCSKHVEDSNKHRIEEIVCQVGYIPELYEDARPEQYTKYMKL